MIVKDIAQSDLETLLSGSGLRFSSGPYSFRLQTCISEIVPSLLRLYANHPIVPEDSFIDFHVSIATGKGLRRWFRPQARFLIDGVEPFTPLPQDQALPMIEWGLNWCITAYSHHVLILHAASVARDDRALVLPAPPGSGKSTLCAALVNRGWRLLSDELTIVSLDTGAISGLSRPVNLKNQSIDIIRNFAPQAYITEPVRDTTKGTVALMAPPTESVACAMTAANPCWIVIPHYTAGAPTLLKPLQTGNAFIQIADNAMNYHLLGTKGFHAVSQLVDRCSHFNFEYSDLDDAIAHLDRLSVEK